MEAEVRIERVETLPEAELAALVTASEAEGYGFVRGLRDGLRTRPRPFDQPGEAFFAARCGGRLVGICGLSRDPYAGNAAVGRVRRLYVLEPYRRLGVGRRLVQAVIGAAGAHFTLLSLRTDNPAAARLYEELGFQPQTGIEGCTHLREVPATAS